MLSSHHRSFTLSRMAQQAIALYLRYGWVLLIILLLVLGGYAAYLLLASTSVYGIGIRSDSVAYIWSARSLAEGLGLGRLDGGGNFKPMTHWPPLYSLLLSLSPWFGLDVVEGARRLAALLAGLSIILAGLVIFRLTRSIWFAGAGALVTLFSPAIAETDLQAMTEPLYIVLSLLALLFLDRYLQRSSRRWLWLSAVFTALSFLTRYIGFSLVLVGALAVIIYSRQPLRARGKDVLIFLAVTLGPAALWFFRNLLLSSSAANRGLTYFPIPFSDFALAVSTVQGWVQPAKTVFAIGAGKGLLALAAVVVAFVLARFRPAEIPLREPNSPLMDLNQMYIGFYLAMVFIARLFFDPMITIFEQRILAPVYLSVLFLLAGVLHSAWRSASAHRWWIGAGLAVIYLWTAYSFVMVYNTESRQIYKTMLENGSGYAYKGEQDSPFAQMLREIPEDALVYTSNVEKFYFLTGRSAYGYPAEIETKFLQEVNQQVKTRVVYFVSFHMDEAVWRALREEIKNMTPVYEDANSFIYSNRPQPEKGPDGS